MGKEKTKTKENIPDSQMNPAEKSVEEKILSRKRRMALVSYLAILFAVSFLLVAVSMVIENRQLQHSEGTLNTRIQQLQANNEEFQQNNKKLTEEVSGLQENLKQANDEVTTLKGEKTALESEKAALESEKKGLETEKETLSKTNSELNSKLADTRRAHELLYEAVTADEEGDYEKLQELLEQIEPIKDLLCPTALEIYMEMALA